MIYALQALGGREERTRYLILKMIDSSVYQECFIPYRDMQKCYQGAWITRREILFPGYLFIDTVDVRTLVVELRKVPLLTRVLGNNDIFIPLSEEEVSFIQMTGGPTHVIEKSIGFIENDMVEVFAGPLQGCEGMIKKIDRHKRTALLEVKMFARTVTVKVALEIVEKKIYRAGYTPV